MSRPEFDFSDPEALLRELDGWARYEDPRVVQDWKDLRALVGPEQQELLIRVVRAKEIREYTIGMRRTLQELRQQADPDGAWRARANTAEQQLAVARARIADLEAKAARLTARAEGLQARLAGRPADPLAEVPAPKSPEPAWTPPLRAVAPDEVLVDAPAEVARVARCVEEIVRQCGGRTTKPEVRSRLPHEPAPHLASAYQHLRLSGRLRVQGSQLALP